MKINEEGVISCSCLFFFFFFYGWDSVLLLDISYMSYSEELASYIPDVPA